jgi:DNA transformation protein and related proteins
MKKSEFSEYIKDVLSEFYPITLRSMFGGYGVYKNQLMFGLIAEDELYFKADLAAAEYFKTYQSEPFVYSAKGKTIKISYWKVPMDVIEDSCLLQQWMDIAYAASLEGANSLKQKPKKKEGL